MRQRELTKLSRLVISLWVAQSTDFIHFIMSAKTFAAARTRSDAGSRLPSSLHCSTASRTTSTAWRHRRLYHSPAGLEPLSFRYQLPSQNQDPAMSVVANGNVNLAHEHAPSQSPVSLMRSFGSVFLPVLRCGFCLGTFLASHQVSWTLVASARLRFAFRGSDFAIARQLSVGVWSRSMRGQFQVVLALAPSPDPHSSRIRFSVQSSILGRGLFRGQAFDSAVFLRSPAVCDSTSDCQVIRSS